MKKLIVLVTVALLAGIVAPAYPQDKERIGALIQDLGSSSFVKRERAAEKLRGIGEPALHALEEATKSDDVEVASRAQAIINSITKKTETESEEKVEAPKLGVHPFVFRFDSNLGSGSSVQITPDGVKVTEKVKDDKGEWVTKEYAAKTVEEFKKKYPEVAKKYGVGSNIIQVHPFKDFNGLDKDFNFDFGNLQKELDKLRKDFRSPVFPPLDQEDLDKYMGHLRRQLQNQYGIEPEQPREQTAPAPTVDRLGVYVKEADEGVVINKVESGSFAEKMGLKLNDIIVALNGKGLTGTWSLRSRFKEAIKTGKVEIEILRNGKKQTFSKEVQPQRQEQEKEEAF